MKYKPIELLPNIPTMQPIVDILIPKLPLSSSSGKVPNVNAQIWGVLSSNGDVDENTKNRLQYFALSNFGLKKHNGYSQAIVDAFSRESRFNTIMWNHWIAVELFLIDKFCRYPFGNIYPFDHNRFNFTHIKAPQELDHVWKIDFTSNIIPKKMNPICIGIQLTTRNSVLDAFQTESINVHKTMPKKKITVMKNSKHINWREDISNAYPSILRPDMTGYMVVNWRISEHNKVENIFQDAFNQRTSNGMPHWWPSLYLPRDTRQDLWKIWLAYHQSLTRFHNFLCKEQKKWQNALTNHIEELQIHEQFAVVKKFLPRSKELRHTFFTDFHTKNPKYKDGNLLCDISYFLHNDLLLRK